MLNNTNWMEKINNAKQSPGRKGILKVLQDMDMRSAGKDMNNYVGEVPERGWIRENEYILLVLFVVVVGGMILYNNMDYFVDNRKKKGGKKKK